MSSSRTRLTAALATAVAGIAVLACAALTATGRLGLATAATLAAAAISLAALTVLTTLVRGLIGQLNRVERRLRHHVETGNTHSKETLRELRADVSTLVRRTEAIESRIRSLDEGRKIDFRQTEALGELRTLLRPRAPMPASRDWAASPDVLMALADAVIRRHPKLVVECGSGASSLWLGYAVEYAGGGQVVALEHDERYADLTRDLVDLHGLGAIVEIRTAPLRPWPDPKSAELWYDTEAIADLADIGLLFVDGPPGKGSPQARYPAGPELLPRCAPDALIVLDDTIREAERQISDRWLAEHPGLERTEHAYEKGAHIFTCTTP